MLERIDLDITPSGPEEYADPTWLSHELDGLDAALALILEWTVPDAPLTPRRVWEQRRALWEQSPPR